MHKLILFQISKSTDFEVHRNWLAITYSLPLKQWYYENTSEWTLDYPPFFAWFEYCLSKLANKFDSKMVVVDNLNYSSDNTIIFQRFSVIITELTLVWAFWRLSQHPKFNSSDIKILGFLTLVHPTLMIVDHIHFQYNGFMFGILMTSLVEMLHGNHLLGGILFAVLLNFKHIYLYLALPYFIFLLRGYCMGLSPKLHQTQFNSFIGTVPFLVKLIKLGGSVILIFLISFFPFIYYQQIPQLLSRLFPFQRGLTHAYWAPNLWSLYSFLDRVLVKLLPQFIPPNSNISTMTRGIVGDTSFIILPQILPHYAFFITLLSQLPILLKLWINPTLPIFLNSIILSGLSSFLFGYHVHEKAIMIVLLPITLNLAYNPNLKIPFLKLNTVATFSVFPLLFTLQEQTFQLLFTFMWLLISNFTIQSNSSKLFTTPFLVYIIGLFFIYIMPSLLNLLHLSNLQFLPLMITSIYTAIPILSFYFWFYYQSLSE